MAIFGSDDQQDKLPDEGAEWPPWDYHNEYEKFREWAAWYSGDPTKLSRVFSDRVNTGEDTGRMWSDDIKDEVRTMLHVPLAGNIAQTSADLLFGKPPEFRIPAEEDRSENEVKNTQERLDEIVGKGQIYSRLVKAAETAAGLGGCYLKADWDAGFKDYPLMTVAQSDNALPTFYQGYLRNVLFHKVIDIKGVSREDVEEDTNEEKLGSYYRHLEYREPGLIQHGLYRGSYNNLGKKIPLSSHPKTEGLEEEIVNPAGIEDDLLVRYVPNMKPNRLWRNSALGQSDYSGIEGVMDALDATYTSWIRDLQLAKARILVPRHLLENEDGELKFNIDQSVFTDLESSPTEKDEITMAQFKIRSQQHFDTARELMLRAVDSAGYAAQTFGLGGGSSNQSGEALKVRERKSVKTKNKKERYFENPIRDILYLMLRIDKNKFETDIIPFRPRVSFPSSYEPSMSDRADTLDKINRAKAASNEVKVRYLHPDWSEEEIKEEVERLKDEQGMNVETPELRA